MTSVERILAAIELNPDRSRVTLRRQDVRSAISDNQRLAAAITGHASETAAKDHEIAYCRTLVEEMGAKIADLVQEQDDLGEANEHQARGMAKFLEERAEMKATIRSTSAQLHTAERDRDAAQRQLSATVRVPKADLFASWPVLWMSWATLPLAAFAAYFAPHVGHHG